MRDQLVSGGATISECPPVTGRRALLAGALSMLGAPSLAQDRFALELDAFAEADRAARSPDGALLFVGSSTIRLWPHLGETFAPRAVVQRGFGGATLGEVVRHRARLFAAHRPGVVILYAGENDIADGIPPRDVVDRFRRLRVELQGTAAGVAPLVFIGLKPSPARFELWPRMQAVNAAIDALTDATAPAATIATDRFLIGANGRPDRSLFLDDLLHFNQAGYRWLAAATQAALARL